MLSSLASLIEYAKSYTSPASKVEKSADIPCCKCVALPIDGIWLTETPNGASPSKTYLSLLFETGVIAKT